MGSHLINSHIQRSHKNPWNTFEERNESKYRAEDQRLCSQQQPASQIIEEFMSYGYGNRIEIIPRKQQALRDFLDQVPGQLKERRNLSVALVILDPCFNNIDIAALLDDRHDHARCTQLIDRACNDSKVDSRNLTLQELYAVLQEIRLARKAERRMIFVPDISSIVALVLASTISKTSAVPVRDFMNRHLTREHAFSVSTSGQRQHVQVLSADCLFSDRFSMTTRIETISVAKYWYQKIGFFFEFHLPYHAMRLGPLTRRKDTREVSDEPLRRSDVLPLRNKEDKDDVDLCYHEAQISSLCWGRDKWFWTELFLVETYFGSEDVFSSYLKPDTGEDKHRSDPPLAGTSLMERPCFDPREYWLRQLEVRMEQIVGEYTVLIETFNKRMEKYAGYVRSRFNDDRSIHTRTLSEVLETIQVFLDTIGGITEAWETFQKSHIFIFTTYAQDKDEYPRILENIIRSIEELQRLRSVLLTKRERFRYILENVHTVSSLSQTETAISQGENIRTLTEMTVYIAFPLLFTAAIFSMDFTQSKDQKKTWEHFSEVLIGTFFLNGAIAWLLHRRYPQKLFDKLAEQLKSI